MQLYKGSGLPLKLARARVVAMFVLQTAKVSWIPLSNSRTQDHHHYPVALHHVVVMVISTSCSFDHPRAHHIIIAIVNFITKNDYIIITSPLHHHQCRQHPHLAIIISRSHHQAMTNSIGHVITTLLG
jgi:hypothetical protein